MRTFVSRVLGTKIKSTVSPFLVIFQIGISPLLSSHLNAQVLNGNVTFNSQADVDAFNYTSVTGVVFISNISSTINNLDHLSMLTSIGKSLLISRQNNLTNLNGLSSLQTVGETVSISDCPNLLNIDGLSALTSCDRLEIGGQFQGNDRLQNIDALSNLTSCHSVKINKNDSITNINPLANFVGFIGDLIIDENNMLTNIDGLANIAQVNGDVTISGSGLTNLNALSKLLTVGGTLTIKGFNLTDISGLSNLTSINSLNIGAKESNLDAFSKLTQIHFLIIDGNSNLTNINGLSKITQIQGSLFMEHNFILDDLSGLANVLHINAHCFINSNSHLTNLNALSKLLFVGNDLEVHDNTALTDFCGLYNLFNSGSIGGDIKIFRNGANTVTITPTDVTVNADQGVCSAVVSEATIGDPVNGCLVPITKSHTAFPTGNVFPVGTTQITWSATDAAGNTATATQNITVVDNQTPVITASPANTTVSCAADVPAADITSVTATDNCSVVITHYGDVITNQTCANRFTLTRTYRATDPAGNYATATQVITVNDVTPPQIIGLTPSQASLWPPNHSMKNIALSYSVVDNCATSFSPQVSIGSNEPVNGTADGDTDPDWMVTDDHNIQLRAERAANGTGRIYTITVTVDDGCNTAVSASTEVRVTHNITSPGSGKPFKVGSIVDFAGEFWDKPGNRHTAKWLIDGNTSVRGSVSEPAGTKNGKVTGSYKFGGPGVYKLQMNVTDQTGVTSFATTNGDLEEIIVVYDPNGGYTYGGGWFNSPAGALKADPSASGKVSYGFAVNYFKNATLPKGETQFEFKVGDLEYNAVNFDYLTISGARAQLKGTGKIIGGQSGINFIMTVIDGQVDGTGIDKVRMKIYNKNSGEIYYDNQPGAGETDDPITPVGTNSSITISSNATNTITKRIEAGEQANIVAGALDVRAYPNPANSNFNLNFSSGNLIDKIKMQVMDAYGRIIETKHITPGQNISFGKLYRPGVYYLRVIQGEQSKELKLVKLSD